MKQCGTGKSPQSASEFIFFFFFFDCTLLGMGLGLKCGSYTQSHLTYSGSEVYVQILSRNLWILTVLCYFDYIVSVL